MPWIIVFLTFVEFSSAKLSFIGIYWNASNPIFRIDNTDHIIDVNRGNNPFEYDQVNIICPTFTEGTQEETYIIYNVSKEEYDSCRITNSNPRIIAICDNPHQLKYFTITFRSFTPQPGGLEFKPGQDYYFITTSTGRRDGLDRRAGGRCTTHHMKVIFKVCCSNGTSKTTSNKVLDDKKDSNKNDSNIILVNNTSNYNQTIPSSVDTSSESLLDSSSLIPTSSSSSSSSTPSPLVNPSHLLNTSSHQSSSSSSPVSASSLASLLPKSPHHQSFQTDLGSQPEVKSSDYSHDSNGNGGGSASSSSLRDVNSPSHSGSSSSTFTVSPLPAAKTVTSSTIFSVPTEHWWRPHYTRNYPDYKWRSKSPGNGLVKDHLAAPSIDNGGGQQASNNYSKQHHSTADSQNGSNDTLRPIAWTIFAIACFIFIIFWALWCKVRRNNVMLPMSK